MENEKIKKEKEEIKEENIETKAVNEETAEKETLITESEETAGNGTPIIESEEVKTEDEETKKEKHAKIPRALRKPIKEKKFNKRYVKYIAHPMDRKFFSGCFEKQDDKYVIRNNLTKDDSKKLNNLYKWIKKNHRSAVKFVPLVFTASVIAAIVIFFTTFANPLLSTAMEKALEAAFQAKVDITGFRLSLVPLRFEIMHITVANKDKPMTNLFEMGRTTIRLKTVAVLRGKVYIEEISAAEIKFGTPRTVSGRLPGYVPKEKPPKERAGNAPPLVDLQNFDAMALLEQEYNKLETPKLYDMAIAAYDTTQAKWQGEVNSSRARVQQIQASARPIVNLNVNNMRDVNAIRSTIQDVNTLIDSVQGATGDVQRMVGGIEADINTARRLEQNARNAFNDDINLLKSYIDIESGAAFAAIEPFIRDIMSDTAEQYLDYGIIALEVMEKLKADSGQPKPEPKPKKEKKEVFRGRDVIFPTTDYPAFYLGKLASDFTIDTWKWVFDLRDVSSDPDITGKPILLELGLTEVDAHLKRQVAFRGSADFRNNSPQKFNAAFNGSGFPLMLDNQLRDVGISGFSGNTAFSLNMTGYNNGGINTGGDVRITNAQLLDPKGTIAIAVAEAVRDARNVNLGIDYRYNVGRRDEFKITSNIFDLIAAALKRIVEAYAQIAMREIERLLRAKIDEYIDGRFVSKDQVDALFAMARGDMTAVNSTRTSLNNKLNELERRLTALGQQATRQATQQAGQALQNALPSTPNLPNIRIPGR